MFVELSTFKSNFVKKQSNVILAQTNLFCSAQAHTDSLKSLNSKVEAIDANTDQSASLQSRTSHVGTIFAHLYEFIDCVQACANEHNEDQLQDQAITLWIVKSVMEMNNFAELNIIIIAPYFFDDTYLTYIFFDFILLTSD